MLLTQSNVLIKNDGRAAISDFGLAQVLDEEFERLASLTNHRGTIRWASPERLEDNGPLAPSSDVWSWAWLIWEFMTEKIPFHFVSHASAVIFHIVTLKFPAYDREAAISEIPTLSKLMQLCWQREPGSRLSMEECIERLEHILEGFEPLEGAGKDQTMFVETSTLFQPTAIPSFRSGPPPSAEANAPTKSSRTSDPPTGVTGLLPPGVSVPLADTGPAIPLRPDKPRKDLPPIPGLDDETPVLTTFGSSHEQRTDLEPSFGVKPQSANVPDHPSRVFNFKGLRSFKPSKTSSLGSFNKPTAISLRKVKNRLLRSSKRKLQQSNDYHGRECDRDITPSPSQPPPKIPASNTDPSYNENRDDEDLRVEFSQEQHSQRQQDITNYLRTVDSWFTGAPLFGSPYLSSRSSITGRSAGLLSILAPPNVVPITPMPYVQSSSPDLNNVPPTQLSSRALIIQDGIVVGQIERPTPIVPPVPAHQPRGRPGPLTGISYESAPSISLQHADTPISSASSHARDYPFPVNTSVIPNGAGLHAVRQFKQSEIKLEPENELNGKAEAQMGVILETGKAIAIKPINFQLESGIIASERAIMSELDGWLRLWGSLEHENIAKVLGSSFVNKVPSVITEWCPSGNIAQYLEKAPQADRPSLDDTFQSKARTLSPSSLSASQRAHFEIQNNILIDDGKVKLADIGIMGFLETQNAGAEMHGRTGDARWTAPEILEGRDYRWRSDIYSFGSLALFILRDELPYAALKTDVAVSKAIYRGDLPINREAASGLHTTQLSYIDYGKVVASGGFGQVKKAVYTKRTRNRSSAVSPTAPNSKAAGITVAVKTLQIHMEVDKERLEKRFMREAYVWSQLKNDHILDFLGFYFSCAGGKTEALLVCPWMENGQSVSYLKQQRLRPVERLHLLLDAAKGLQYLHSRVPPICHGDIKGSNVLIKNDGRAAICDFGLAQVLDEEFERLASQTIHRGTVRWTSPERLDDNGPLAPSSDVWSWAWLIWEFMTEKIPFHLVNNASAVIFHIVTLKFPAYEQEVTISEVPTLSKLMQLCWQKEPESRLRMEECIERLEHILEGFEPPEPVRKDQNTLVGTSTLFQPTATPSFPPGPPPPAEFYTPPKPSFELPTGIVPPSPPGAPVPPAYPGPIIPPRSDKSHKDLPPIPGQDDEAPILTTFDSSHEQRTDLESNWGAKPRSTNVPDNPPSAFTFKGLRSFKTSSSESSSKAAAIGLKKLTKRLLPSSKRKAQRGNDSEDDEWDWDIIPGPSPSQPPQIITAGNPDPSYHVNSDGADLRHQIDYIMRTLQRLESSQAEQSWRQQDITTYLRQVDGWFSGAPVFGSPYVSRPPPPIFVPPGQPPTMVHPGPGAPFIPMPTVWASPSSSPVSSRRTGPLGQPIIVGQPPIIMGQPPIIIQQPAQSPVIPPPTQIIPPVWAGKSRVRPGPLTVISYESLPGSSPQHPDSPVSSTSSHPRDHRFPVGPQVIRTGAGLPIIRQFKRSEIQLEPEDEFDGKEEAQRGVILETGKAIAIKPVNFQLESGRTASERALMSELHGLLSLWGSLEPEHIAKVVGSAFVNGVPWVITEWCSGGNLAQYLEKTPRADRRSLGVLNETNSFAKWLKVFITSIRHPPG
ncbi:hypothetical protein FRC00_013760 [Tulasnella sp. 408]|nr:hypothetical protein FRC00_013760 [Tulasnella sp. 408]